MPGPHPDEPNWIGTRMTSVRVQLCPVWARVQSLSTVSSTASASTRPCGPKAMVAVVGGGGGSDCHRAPGPPTTSARS